MEDVLGILTGMLAILLIFGGPPTLIILLYYFSRKAKHKERMAMIEKGVDPSIYLKQEERPFHKVLLFGMLLGGVGLGLLIGYIVSAMAMARQETIMPIMALLFGGLGLIGYYIYRKKTENKSA
jgi:hypothetical protein